ncbi:MAG: PorT family protein [Chitinophagaceae bacterium]|nr:MAG: PorT family protein [Chitinophagaceae bacterium]
MKRLLVACLILTGTAVSAQRVSGGIKAGVNISNFNSGDFEDVKKEALVGFHGGGYLNFKLIGGLSLQPELLVSTAGAKFDYGNGVKQDVKLTYLTVPVMAKFTAPGGVYFELGPQVGFKLGEDYGDQTIDNFAKNLDLSAGAGVGFKLGPVGVGGRYLLGLSKVGDFDSNDLDPNFKNGVIQIGLSLNL